MIKKIGRPPSESPKEKRITVRLEKKHEEILDEYISKNNVSTTDAVRKGIEKLKE